MNLTEKEIIHFWACVDIRSKDECWPWRLSVQWHRITVPSGQGYGQFETGGRYGPNRINHRAHKLAYVLVYGEPKNLVCHSCGNPSCCNPYHLYDGTLNQNLQDAYDHGARHGTLSPEQRDQVYALYAAGGISLRALARKFGVSYSAIWHIIYYRKQANRP
jgi:hypothetical protein